MEHASALAAMGCVLVVTCALWMGWAFSAHAADGPGAPVHLRCEYRVNPLGLDIAAPRLSWEVNDPRRGAVQSAYQVLVAETPADLDGGAGTCWDSGKIGSGQSIQVVYGGKPLEARRRYYWRVRTWDAAGTPSPYSETAWWEMALLSPEDWTARWITMAEEERAVEIEMGDWVWHPGQRGEKARALFRTVFEIDPGAEVARAKIRMTVDNAFTLYVNGKRIGHAEEWKSFADYDVTNVLRTGKNVIAVKATNSDGAAGVLFGMRVDFKDGRTIAVRSSDDWRTAAVAKPDWFQPDYDDGGWVKPVVLGEYGCEPWGTIKMRVPERSLYLRKEFKVNGEVTRARVYVTGLGLYQLWVNGKRVGNDELTPGWTCYPKRVQYQVYDITTLLRSGPNAVGGMLGNGWWGGNMAGAWKDGPSRLIAQLEFDYPDGERQTVVTDEAWRAHVSPILEDSHYHGETHDARLEMPGWAEPGFDGGGWTKTAIVDEPIDVLRAQYGPTLQVTEELAPVSVNEVAEGHEHEHEHGIRKGVYVYDFGQNMAGRVRLNVQGQAGTRVQLRFAEILLPDGSIYTDNYRSARATDVYFCKGQGEETWEPRFTYRGFRYAELTGYPGKPDKETLLARVLHSAPPMAGTFECSNDLINRVNRNILWGQRSNMHSVPTDCPQRDERLGWTGDAQVFGPTSCWNMDMAGFYTKWLHDLTDSQAEDGAMTDVAPCLGWKAAAPAWGDVIAVQPWTVYLFYGDTRVIEQNYNATVAWVEYMRRHAKEGVLYDREGYADWVPVVPSPKKPVGAAYYHYSTKLLAQMAAAIGRNDDAAKYGALADRIAQAFNEAYLDESTNTYPDNTQTACILPLCFGIVPEERRAAVFEHLVADIAERDYHLTTGFLGTAYLMRTLTDMGGHDIAYRLAVQRTYPSWGHMVEKGGTTIWERWNSDRYEEVGPGMNSFNHFALGSVGQWYYEALAGINPDPERPGFKHIIIRPRPAGDLTWVRAAYPSMHGLIRSQWRIDSGQFVLDIQIPANTSATVYVPAKKQADVTGDVDAPSVTFLRMEDEAAVYRVAGGTYRLVSGNFTG